MANRAMPGGIALRVEYTDVHHSELKYATAVQIIRNSFLDPSYQPSWTVHSLRTVKNFRLYQLYQAKARELKQQDRDTSEHDMFTCYKTMDLIRNILENGLQTRQSSFNFLGDSKRGVNLCKHADIQLKAAENTGQEECYLIMYKVMLGKALPVLPSPDNSQLQPVEGYDSHISNMVVNQRSPLGQQAIRSQVFCYEYINGQLSTCPRHVLPYVVVCYRRNRTSIIPPTPSMPVLSMQLPQQQQHPQSRPQIQPPPPPLVQMAPAPGIRHSNFFPARSESQPPIPSFQPRLPPRNPFIPQNMPMMQPFANDIATNVSRMTMVNSPAMNHARAGDMPPSTLHVSAPGILPPMSRAPYVMPTNVSSSLQQHRPGMRLPYITPSADIASVNGPYSGSQSMVLPVRTPMSSSAVALENYTPGIVSSNYGNSYQTFNSGTTDTLMPDAVHTNGMTVPVQIPPGSGPSHVPSGSDNSDGGIGMRLPIVIQPEEQDEEPAQEIPSSGGSHMRLPTIIRDESPNMYNHVPQENTSNEVSSFNINQQLAHDPEPIKIKSETTTRKKKYVVIEPIIIDEEEDIEDIQSFYSQQQPVPDGSALDDKEQQPALDLTLKNTPGNPEKQVLQARQEELRASPCSDDELVIDDMVPRISPPVTDRNGISGCESEVFPSTSADRSIDEDDGSGSPPSVTVTSETSVPSLPTVDPLNPDTDEDDTLPDLPNNDADMDSLAGGDPRSPSKLEDGMKSNAKVMSDSPDLQECNEGNKSTEKELAVKAKKKRKRTQSPWLATKPKKRKLNKGKVNVKKQSDIATLHSKLSRVMNGEDFCQENTVYKLCHDGSIEMYFDMYSQKATNETSRSKFLEEIGPSRTLIEVENDVPEMTDFFLEFDEEFSPYELVHLGDHMDVPCESAQPEDHLVSDDVDANVNSDWEESNVDSGPEEPTSPPVEAYHDFAFEMPSPPNYNDTERDGPECQEDGTECRADISLEKVKVDQRYQPKVVVEDITSTAEWGSYLNKSKEESSDDDVMNLKITCVQSLICTDNNQKDTDGWDSIPEHLTAAETEGKTLCGSEHSHTESAEFNQSRMELAVDVSGDLKVPQRSAELSDSNGGNNSPLPKNADDRDSEAVSMGVVSEENTTELDNLLTQRSKLWESLKELDEKDDTESVGENTTTFDPSSVERLGTKLSILRDLDEANSEKRKKCLAKLSELQKNLKRKKSEDREVEVKESALDLLLDDSDFSSDNESEEQPEDHTGKIDQHCSQMKPNGKHDDHSDSDENRSRGQKRRMNRHEQKTTRGSTAAKSTEQKSTTTTTRQEPYCTRLRSNSLTPDKKDVSDVASKQQKHKHRKRSRKRRRKQKSLKILSNNTCSSETEEQTETHFTETANRLVPKDDGKCKQLAQDPKRTGNPNEKNHGDAGDKSVPKQVDTTSDAAHESDTPPTSEKWAETCETIFMGERKGDESCLYDGYTETSDSPKPCPDPTQWLNTLIRLNQKGKDSSLPDKTEKGEKSKSFLKPAEPKEIKIAQDDTKSTSSTTQKPESEHGIVDNKDAPVRHLEHFSMPMEKSDENKDVYVTHPKYPAMPRGMKIKRTSSIGSRTTVRKSCDDIASASSESNAQNLSKEEVSQLVSKVLKIFVPEQSACPAKQANDKNLTPAPSAPAKNVTRKDSQTNTAKHTSMTRASQLHGHAVSKPNPSDPRSRYPQPYKKFGSGDPRSYGRNIRPPNVPQKPHDVFAHKSAPDHPKLLSPSTVGPKLPLNANQVSYMADQLDINAVEANTIALLAFSAINASATEEPVQTHCNPDPRHPRASGSATSPRIRTDSASSASDSLILSPIHQTTSPLASPKGSIADVVNRDPRRHSSGSMSRQRDPIATVQYPSKPEIDASLAIEKNMGSEAKSKVHNLWKTSICTKPSKELFALKPKVVTTNQESSLVSSHPSQQTSDKHAQRDSRGKNEPWNYIVYDIEVTPGTYYKKMESYGKRNNDPRLKPKQHTMDGNEEHIGRRLTKYTSKIPLQPPTLKPEILSRSSSNVTMEKDRGTAQHGEKVSETSEFANPPAVKELRKQSEQDKELTSVRETASVIVETKTVSHLKGQKAGSMWSNMLGESRPNSQEETEIGILTEKDIGGCDDSTRITMTRVWDLNNLEWASLNTEMMDILHERISQIDDSMLFNDPTKGLTSERRRKLMASESLNRRVANELKIEDSMQSLFHKINQLRQEADLHQQSGMSDEELKRLRREIKVLDVKYEKFFKDLEELNRFHKSNVVEVLPDIFRLPQEVKKYISVEGNMLFLVSSLSELDCRKLYALREEIMTQKKLINNPNAPFVERRQARSRLGWLHGERKEALCEICINMLNNKESVLQKLSSRILWCRKGEQALRDTGSSCELISYIEERIRNLEMYLKVLRFVQRTENGIWVYCRSGTRFQDSATVTKGNRKRSRTMSCESRRSESVPRKQEVDKRKEHAFSEDICTEIPGLEMSSIPSDTNTSVKASEKLNTESSPQTDRGKQEQNLPNVPSGNSIRETCSNLDFGDPLVIDIPEQTTSCEQKSDAGLESKQSDHQETVQEDKSSVSCGTTDSPCAEQQSAAHGSSCDKESRHLEEISDEHIRLDKFTSDSQADDDRKSRKANTNTDEPSHMSSVDQCATDPSSVHNLSAHSVEPTSKESETEQQAVDEGGQQSMEQSCESQDHGDCQRTTDKMENIIHSIDVLTPERDGESTTACTSQRDTNLNKRKIMADDSESRYTSEFKRRHDQDRQVVDFIPEDGCMSGTEAAVIPDAGDDQDTEKTNRDKETVIVPPDDSDTSPSSDTRNVVLIPDTGDSDQTDTDKCNGNSEPISAIPDKGDVDKKVSKLLALLKACSKNEDANAQVTGEEQSGSHVNVDMPEKVKAPQTATSQSGPIGDHGCTTSQDMDISDISDSAQIEICSTPENQQTNTAVENTEQCDQYGDVDWRPVLKSTGGHVITGTANTVEGSAHHSSISHPGSAQTEYKGGLLSGNNNNSQKEHVWEHMNKAQERSCSKWDLEPEHVTHFESVKTSEDPSGTSIAERRTIRVDNTPWRSEHKSQGDHRDELTKSHPDPSSILAKADLFKRASDLVQSSSSPQYDKRNSPDIFPETKGNAVESRGSPAPDIRNERIVTITRGQREASPSGSIHSRDRRSSSIESNSRYGDDGKHFSRSRSRSPNRSSRSRRSQNARRHPLHSPHESSSASTWSSEGPYGRLSTAGGQSSTYQNVSCNDPTIRRILAGDPVLIEMLSHPTTTTRLASMLPNVQDRETVFNLAREVQNDLLHKERRSLDEY